MAIPVAFNHSTVNLQELVDQLTAAGRIKPARLRDIRSSVSRYARMLGYERPQDCSERSYVLDHSRRKELIEEHLKDASPHVLRNVKNNVSFVLRQGQALGLISPPAPTAEVKLKQFGRRKVGNALPSLIPKQGVAFHLSPYSLPLERWPTSLRRQYDAWKKWVSDEPIPVSGYNPKNRAATIENKTRKFEAFFGYLYNVRGIKDLDFRMLLDFGPPRPPDRALGNFSQSRKDPDVGLLAEFIEWHQEHRLGRRSAQAREVVSVAASVARRFYALRAARAGRQGEAHSFKLVADQMGQLRKDLAVKPIIPKEQRRVSRADLLRAARAEFPQHRSLPASQSGTELAARAGRAVALMLLVHHPLRNKHYREARLSHNLVKKPNGKWYLRFAGEDITAGRKVVSRHREPDNYEVPLDPEVANYLEQYLQEWRPRLVSVLVERLNRLRANQAAAGRNKASARLISELERCGDYLFLHGRGGRFTQAGFSQWIQAGTYRWLGARVNPQLISQIVSEEMAQKIISPSSTQPSTNTTPDSGRINHSRNNFPH